MPTQADARKLALSRGYDAGEVDAFIQHEGGARTSYDRINSAFGGGAMPGAGAPASMAGIDGAMGAGGMTAAGATPSTSAINNVVEPPAMDPSLKGLGAGLSALGSGGGGGGNQEATSADTQSGGMLRGIGVRRPPMSTLVLSGRAY